MNAALGLPIIPLVGFLALGSKVSNWYLITRSKQNAADASAIAAAINYASSQLEPLLRHVNLTIRRRAMRKFKRFAARGAAAALFLSAAFFLSRERLVKTRADLFVH